MSVRQQPGAARDQERSDRADRSGGQRRDRGQSGDQRQRGRSAAEWVSLGISVLIIAALLGTITYFHFGGGDAPASLEVRPHPDQAYRAGDIYYVPVEVANRGAKTAADVTVKLTLRTAQGRQTEPTEVTVQFLAGHATHQGVVAFPDDPAGGQITVEALSFSRP